MSGHLLLAVVSVAAAAITMAVGALGAALGESRIAAAAMDALARQPDEASSITRTLFVSLAMVESTAIFCLVVALILLFANPFASSRAAAGAVSPSLTTFLFEAANFLLLAAVLGWIFFRPVRAAIERRRAALETERRDGERARADAERQLVEAEARRREVEASFAPLRAEARREADRKRGDARERPDPDGEERARLEAELAACARADARAGPRCRGRPRTIVARLLAESRPGARGGARALRCRDLSSLRDAAALAPIVESARRSDADARAAGGAARASPCDRPRSTRAGRGAARPHRAVWSTRRRRGSRPEAERALLQPHRRREQRRD